MPTIGQVVNVMKEAGMDTLAMPWANARAAHLQVVHRMMPMEVGDNQKGKFDANDNDPLMYTQKVETLEPFSSHNTSKDREGLFERMYQCYGTGPMDSGWHLASWPDHTEHIYQVKKRQ